MILEKITLGKKVIGDKQPTYIIAELSANHKGNIDIAKQTIKAAADAGADALKMQTYTADSLTLDIKNDYFKIDQKSVWDGRYLYDVYKEGSMPYEWQKELKEYAESLGIDCFSAPFDIDAADFLEALSVPAYKIASYEITDIGLIKRCAEKGKPIIISTGVATEQDIELAVQTCRSVGNNDIILLKCTSAYPTPPEEANLRMIPDLAKRFNVLSGLSDHTTGIVAPVTAVALGAVVIEKHIVLNKDLDSLDASFSLSPEEFAEMVAAVRIAEKQLGNIDYNPTQGMLTGRKIMRSLFFSEDIQENKEITKQNVRSVRPGNGLHPRHLLEILGKKVNRAVKKGEPVSWEVIK